MLAPRSEPAPLPADGLHDLPAGKIAAVATYLEMWEPPSRSSRALPGRLDRIGNDLARYRRLYARVGEPWLWFSRAAMSDANLRAIIGHPAVDALALHAEGRDIGIVELDFRRPDECELAFFGLVPEAVGRRIGRALIDEVVRRAFARPIRRLWLHTCTLDHPRAIPLYASAGFRPYRRAIEIADDPRLGGTLPPSAAPGFPVV